jgi:hypothetical protein
VAALHAYLNSASAAEYILGAGAIWLAFLVKTSLVFKKNMRLSFCILKLRFFPLSSGSEHLKDTQMNRHLFR